MGDVNEVILKGRLTRNPELRDTPSGVSVCDFSLATNRYIGGKQKTTYHKCTTWNKTAEWLAGENGARTGDTLFVEGTLVHDDFETTKGDPATRTSGRYKVDNCRVEIIARRKLASEEEEGVTLVIYEDRVEVEEKT